MKYKILENLAKNIKRLRSARGWSQEDLAKKAGVHRTYIGSIERNERNVSLINVERISIALGVKSKNLIS